MAGDVLRLREVDQLLRAEGINAPELAKKLKVTLRTVHGILNTLRTLVGPTEIEDVPPPDGRREGRKYIQRYAGKPPQFFAKSSK